VSEPYFRRIIADIRSRVASGEWPPGHKLPTTRELVEHYRVQLDSPTLAVGTLEKALTIMKESGELRGQQGLGVFVSDPGTPTS
jgi:GntR family transcriptional regulator